jgi:DedD protein
VSDYPVVNDIDELVVKKRARRRLVGAVALALLAAIVLPLAMDSKAPPAVPDLQVSVPERSDSPQVAVEPEAEAGKIDIEPDSELAVGEALPVPSVPPPFEVAPELAPPPAIGPEPTPPVARPAAVAPPPVLTQPQPAAPQAPVLAHTQTPAAPPPAAHTRDPAPAPGRTQAAGKDKDAEAARVLALLSGSEPQEAAPAAGKARPKDEPKETGKTKVFIQVGSFSDAARARAMASDLQKRGYAARAEKAGKVTRVRIGPLSRHEGERTVAKLNAQGRNAVLTSR